MLRGVGTVAALGAGGLAAGLLAPSAAAAAVVPDPRLLTATPQIRPRTAWAGSSSPVTGPLPVERPGDVKFLLVHHTAQPGNGYTAAQVPGLMRGMYAYHVGPAKRWADLAYNFVVDRYGGIWEGRAGSLTAPVIPAATGGTQGFDQLGCFLGDHAVVPPTPQAAASMISLLAWLARRYGVDTTPGATVSFVSRGSNRWPAGRTVTTRTIEGHRSMSLTTCPGDAAYALVRDVFPAAVTQLRPSDSPVDALYRSLGGPASVLGPPVAPETRTATGRCRQYVAGSICWTATTGAHEVHGAIHGVWTRYGREAGLLGYPVTDELVVGAGRVSHFQRGSISWSPTTGAHEVHGAIRGTWLLLGSDTGVLGPPISDELRTEDGRGRVSHFLRGSVYWTPTTGAYEVRGAIRATWAGLGGVRSWLGYPRSNEYPVPGGQAEDFEHGTATWSARTGVVTLTRR